jgi:uncharacterized DUF497 family protein
MKIVWDEPKRISNLAKHDLDFATVDEGFFAEAAILPAKQGRWLAIGRLADGSIAVVFATLGTEAISIVSMRRANRAERRLIE